MSVLDGRTITEPELDRVIPVFIKLAKAHLLFEFAESSADCSDPEVWFAPLEALSPEEELAFNDPPSSNVYPEIGSRAFIESSNDTWWEIQPGRYRYLVRIIGSPEVRIVLSEYIAVTVRFD